MVLADFGTAKIINNKNSDLSISSQTSASSISNEKSKKRIEMSKSTNNIFEDSNLS
jgi:hypothetical protein